MGLGSSDLQPQCPLCLNRGHYEQKTQLFKSNHGALCSWTLEPGLSSVRQHCLRISYNLNENF